MEELWKTLVPFYYLGINYTESQRPTVRIRQHNIKQFSHFLLITFFLGGGLVRSSNNIQ